VQTFNVGPSVSMKMKIRYDTIWYDRRVKRGLKSWVWPA